MRTWREKNPGWEYKLWDNNRCRSTVFRCQAQINLMGELCGKADIMRYEILQREGGLYFDADMECIRPLDDHFLMHTTSAVYENESVLPGLVTQCFLGSVPSSPILNAIVNRIAMGVPAGPAHITTGPSLLTSIINELGGEDIHVYPSRVFLPMHYGGRPAPGRVTSYGRHYWGNTMGTYERGMTR